MEYDVALEKKANVQANFIIDLEYSVDGQTVLANTTYYAANSVATGTNRELNKIQEMMNQLAASVPTQSAIMATLSSKMNRGSSSIGKTTDKKKERPGLHVCAHCKRKVCHKDGNFLEMK